MARRDRRRFAACVCTIRTTPQSRRRARSDRRRDCPRARLGQYLSQARFQGPAAQSAADQIKLRAACRLPAVRGDLFFGSSVVVARRVARSVRARGRRGFRLSRRAGADPRADLRRSRLARLRRGQSEGRRGDDEGRRSCSRSCGARGMRRSCSYPAPISISSRRWRTRFSSPISS